LRTARLTEGDATPLYHPETVDLVAMLRDVCRQQRDIAPCAQILEDYPTGTLPVTGDPQLLSRAFGNLLANAIKYSPTRAQVSVRMESRSLVDCLLTSTVPASGATISCTRPSRITYL
jgi:signal transduction histidine kinase